jgi:DNA repair protein RecO (recombination protein O)
MISPFPAPSRAGKTCDCVQAMKLPRTYQTEAIIIKRMNLGEADRILILYTANHGKVKAVAKGSRRPKSKLGGHVELLTHSTLLLAKGKSLDIITQAQTINSYLPLKDDLKRMSFGLYASELIDYFTEERIENRELFRLLIDTLQRLTESSNPDIVLRYFELHMLSLSGYRPQLQKCTNCNQVLRPIPNYFSSSQGGALCPDCAYQEPAVLRLSLNALKVLRTWQTCDFASASRININAELARELEGIMRDHIRFVLDRQIKSTAWLDRLKQQQT